ncbi:MAG: VanW family protein [Actinobacteria bacterium]|nr:VanW family protein [Actinomycetota bacterium]
MKRILEKSWIRIPLLVVATVLLITVGLGVTDAALFTNKIHKGVEIGGIPMGGKTRAEAIKDIDKLADVLESKPIVIGYQDRTWSASPGGLNARVDREKTARKAFSIGRRGDTAEIIKERLNLWFKKKDVKPIFNRDRNKLDVFMSNIAKDVDKPFVDATIKVAGDDRIVVTSSEKGRKVDKKVLSLEMLEASASRGPRRIDLPVRIVEPDIHEDDLSVTKEVVKQMIKAPVTIRYKEESWSITQKQIIDWISFNKTRIRDSWKLDVNLDRDKVASYLKKITATVATEPKDAKFDVKGDVVVIVPSQAGLKVDIERAITGVNDACKLAEERYVMLSTEVVEPKLTTEDAQRMGIKEKISSYATYFNPRQASRVNNIKTLARALDGIIIAPGEVFSFNGKIGPRSASKGYEEAMAIINGELVPTLGGGICQVATTLFNTIFFGGYEVVERHNHSLFISHYPTGRDATVSYGGPDLKFKNNSPTHVLIKAWATSSSITINFYSTNQGIKVEYSTSAPSNFKNYPVKYINDPTLPRGVTKVRDKGVAGRDITVYRTITKNGAVVKKDRFFSRYKPQTAVIIVGTG